MDNLYYLNFNDDVFWYIMHDGQLFDSNPTGFRYETLSLPCNFNQDNLKPVEFYFSVDGLFFNKNREAFGK